jgi:hypothetical protein
VKLYDLPLWALDNPRGFPETGYQGAGWKIVAPEVPHTRSDTFLTPHFKATRKKYPHYATMHLSIVDQPNQSVRIAPQVKLIAPSRLAAQSVFELLRACISVMDGNVLRDNDEGIVVPANRRRLEDLSEQDLSDAVVNTLAIDGVGLAAKLATRVSRSRSLSYALYKLKMSYNIASTHHVELNPYYNPKKYSVTKFRFQHVILSTAITAAYSAIEEMQLEPRPIKNKPVKEANGDWNVDAYTDLVTRLTKAHVDLSKGISWNIRGSVTRVHKSKRAPKGTKLPWTKGIVRDKQVKLEDALVSASWLRSKCTTHRYGAETASITMFDVANVQNLARRLLLERIKVWGDIFKTRDRRL